MYVLMAQINHRTPTTYVQDNLLGGVSTLILPGWRLAFFAYQ